METLSLSKSFRKEVNMKFTDKMKEFMFASNKAINSSTKFTLLDDELESLIGDLSYCTASDGKKNIANDFIVVGGDFKKATEQAKNKVKNGEAATTK